MKILSDDQLVVLTVWQESRSEPELGMNAVCWVIRNRRDKRTGGPNLGMLSDGTIPGTVLRYGQFSGWHWKDPNFRGALTLDMIDPAYILAMKLWMAVLIAPGTDDPTKGALFYYNPKAVTSPPVWLPYVTLTTTIGAHSFYKPTNSNC